MRTKTQQVTGWIARLAVVALGAAFSLAANAQGGRVLTKSDVIQIKVVSQPDMDTTTRIEFRRHGELSLRRPDQSSGPK